jgi:hypothetical protein
MLALRLNLKEFQQLLFVNRAKTLLKTINVTNEHKTEASPEFTVDGSPIIYVVEPVDDERHIVLGKFMDAWSLLEIAIAEMLADVTGVDVANIPVLMNALGTRGELDVISILGPTGLKPSQREALTKLLGRIKDNNTKRNRIVHGHWVLEVWLYDWNGRLGLRRYQHRMYDPSDPDVRRSLSDPTSKAARAGYMFSLPRIKGVTAEVRKLATDISRFTALKHGIVLGPRRYLVEGQFRGES